MDLDTLGRHHAERVHETVATATPPQLATRARGGRPDMSRLPKPVWAVLAAMAVLVVLGLPSLLREPESEPTPITTPDGPGEFTSTGRLNTGCAWCQAIVLEDGRVLVLGQAPEIYDPESGTFTLIGADGAVGNARSAVLLDGGQVLSTDGNTQWLFDPAATSFQQVGEIPSFSMARLGDGRVLLLAHPGDATSNRTFLFDPESGEFTEGPETLHPHGDGLSGAVVSLTDGRVLLLGTMDSELYDPDSGAFVDLGDRIDRSGFTATVLADGRVLIAGGQEGEESNDMVVAAEIFDPGTGEFTVTGELTRGRFWHAAALLPNGRVLVVGGSEGGAGDGTDQAEIYDPGTGSFRPVVTPMTRERLAPGAVTLADGRVLVLGHYPGNGGSGSGQGASTAELFNLESAEDGSGDPIGDNPTEFGLSASFDLADVQADSASPLDLDARMEVPEGALSGMAGVSVMASLDVPGESSSGTISATVGTPFDQNLSIDLSEMGGSGGGGEGVLPPECDDGCDLVVPIMITWTGSAAPPPALLSLGLEVAYEGRRPEAADGLKLTIIAP